MDHLLNYLHTKLNHTTNVLYLDTKAGDSDYQGATIKDTGLSTPILAREPDRAIIFIKLYVWILSICMAAVAKKGPGLKTTGSTRRGIRIVSAVPSDRAASLAEARRNVIITITSLLSAFRLPPISATIAVMSGTADEFTAVNLSALLRKLLGRTRGFRKKRDMILAGRRRRRGPS